METIGNTDGCWCLLSGFFWGRDLFILPHIDIRIMKRAVGTCRNVLFPGFSRIKWGKLILSQGEPCLLNKLPSWNHQTEPIECHDYWSEPLWLILLFSNPCFALLTSVKQPLTSHPLLHSLSIIKHCEVRGATSNDVSACVYVLQCLIIVCLFTT